MTTLKTSGSNISTGTITRDVAEIKNSQKKKSFKACSTKVVPAKSCKPKVRCRRRKQITGRQDGFEVIEPDFTKKPTKILQELAPIDDDPDFGEGEASDCVAFETKKEPLVVFNKSEIVNQTIQTNSQTIDRCDIANLEREIVKNLRLFDEDIDLKSPMINKIIDFPITSAVIKWCSENSPSFNLSAMPANESVGIWSIEKKSSLQDDDDNISEISDFHTKSETDSDYSSDFQTKHSSPALANPLKNHEHDHRPKPESYCALM